MESRLGAQKKINLYELENHCGGINKAIHHLLCSVTVTLLVHILTHALRFYNFPYSCVSNSWSPTERSRIPKFSCSWVVYGHPSPGQVLGIVFELQCLSQCGCSASFCQWEDHNFFQGVLNLHALWTKPSHFNLTASKGSMHILSEVSATQQSEHPVSTKLHKPGFSLMGVWLIQKISICLKINSNILLFHIIHL